MEASKKLKEVFDMVRPHINGHKTAIDKFIFVIRTVEKLEALSQHDVIKNEVAVCDCGKLIDCPHNKCSNCLAIEMKL
jgi:hypothetical protein